jgi:hypothetical protein
MLYTDILGPKWIARRFIAWRKTMTRLRTFFSSLQDPNQSSVSSTDQNDLPVDPNTAPSAPTSASADQDTAPVAAGDVGGGAAILNLGSTDAGSADAGNTNAATGDGATTDSGGSGVNSSDAGSSDSGKTDAGKTDAGTTDAGSADGGSSDGGSDASAGEAPTFHVTSSVPVNVLADTVDQFVDNSNAALGGVGELGHMKPTVTWNLELDDKGKVTRVNMVVDTAINRPRWSGGRPQSDQEKALIKKAEDLIKAHEERHRDIARDFTSRAVTAAHGQTEATANKTLARFMKDMDAAQAAMDHREGLLIVEHNGPNGRAGPASDVKLGPAP